MLVIIPLRIGGGASIGGKEMMKRGEICAAIATLVPIQDNVQDMVINQNNQALSLIIIKHAGFCQLTAMICPEYCLET